jgi:hypothetical protein
MAISPRSDGPTLVDDAELVLTLDKLREWQLIDAGRTTQSTTARRRSTSAAIWLFGSRVGVSGTRR